jgi:GAF domain-containing protein
VAKLVPYDHASIVTVNHDCPEVVAENGSRTGWRVGQNYLQESDARIEWAQLPENRRKPLLISDIQTENGAIKDDSNASFHSWIRVPMVAGDKVFGLLNLENQKPNFYTEEHAALVQTFANQAGIAIEKAQLYQTL